MVFLLFVSGKSVVKNLKSFSDAGKEKRQNIYIQKKKAYQLTDRH